MNYGFISILLTSSFHSFTCSRFHVFTISHFHNFTISQFHMFTSMPIQCLIIISNIESLDQYCTCTYTTYNELCIYFNSVDFKFSQFHVFTFSRFHVFTISRFHVFTFSRFSRFHVSTAFTFSRFLRVFAFL